MKRTILFLGRFYPKGLIKSAAANSRGTIGLSNHNFETMLMEGLSMQKDVECLCISLPGVFSFPRYNKKLFTKREKYVTPEGITVVSPFFCNLIGINRYSKRQHLTRTITKFLQSCEADRIDVIINTPREELLCPLLSAAKKVGKRVRIVVIVPDIPQMITTMTKMSTLKKRFVEKNNGAGLLLTNRCNGLVLLSEAMIDFFRPGMPYIVMEGLVNVQQPNDINSVEQEEPFLLYTGTLNRAFGIVELIDAFEKIEDNNLDLVICGSGPDTDYVKERASRNRRIKYIGLVSREESLSLQRGATILVNPRTSVGEYTKYSFPSKTMEYLLSGRPVVCNKLPGIPPEYYEHVFCPQDESSDALAECIKKVLGKPKEELDERGRRGRQFVLENKNSKKQVGRILDFLSSL